MEHFIDYYEHFGYVGIFVVLFFCGLGLPIPEDITLIASGYLVHSEALELYRTIAICFIGVLAGDFTTYTIGRKWGYILLEIKFFRRLFTEKRIKSVEKYFEKYGGKTVFFVRFLPGVRATAYWTAGLFNMGVLKFLFFDFIAALISVPTIIYVSFYFGAEIDLVIAYLRKAEYALAGLIIFFITIVVLKIWRKKRKQKKISKA